MLPSSGRLAEELTLPAAALAGPARILEVGAGTGSVTRALVSTLPAGSRLDVIEANGEFAAVLQDIVTSSSTVTGRVFPVDIEAYLPDTRYDGIVSALPMTNFAPDAVDNILRRYLDMLMPGGWLSYFAYLGTRHARRVLASAAEWERHRAVEARLDRFVTDYGVRRRTVWWNLPPATVHYLRGPTT